MGTVGSFAVVCMRFEDVIGELDYIEDVQAVIAPVLDNLPVKHSYHMVAVGDRRAGLAGRSHNAAPAGEYHRQWPVVKA